MQDFSKRKSGSKFNSYGKCIAYTGYIDDDDNFWWLFNVSISGLHQLSTPSQSCPQHISYPTSATNIDVAGYTV